MQANEDLEEIKYLFKNREELLLQKFSAYGTENLYRIGLFGIFSRMYDKMERLSNAMNGTIENGKISLDFNEELEEAVLDTVRDLAGYSVLFEWMYNTEKNDNNKQPIR